MAEEHLFPTYEIGSLPKLAARVKALKGEEITADDFKQVQTLAKTYAVNSVAIEGTLERLSREKRKANPEERKLFLDFNALLNLRIQEKSGLDFVYDGEARR